MFPRPYLLMKQQNEYFLAVKSPAIIIFCYGFTEKLGLLECARPHPADTSPCNANTGINCGCPYHTPPCRNQIDSKPQSKGGMKCSEYPDIVCSNDGALCFPNFIVIDNFMQRAIFY